MRSLKKGFAFVVLVFALNTGVFGAGPCIVTQVDQQTFASGSRIPVYAVSVPETCSATPVADQKSSGFEFFNPYAYNLARLDSNGNDLMFESVFVETRVPMADVRARTQVGTLPALPDGRYRLVTTNGDNFLEGIYFTVGTLGESDSFQSLGNFARPKMLLPYLRSAAVVKDGYLYCRCDLGPSTFADGYLYQVQNGRIEILPIARFRVVDPQDQSIFVNLPHVRGGTLDLGWVRVKLDNNNFDPNAPVYASITAGGGGVTVNGIVYDPSDPAKYFFGFSAIR